VIIRLFAVVALTVQSQDSTPTAKELARLVAEYEQGQLADRLDLRVKYGLPVEHLPDLSYARAQKVADRSREVVRRLDLLSPKALTSDEWIVSRALRWEHIQNIEAARFYWLSFASVTPYSTPLAQISRALGLQRFATSADADRFMMALGELGPLVDSITAGLEARRGRKILLPKDEITLVVPLVRSYARPPNESPFGVADARLASLDTTTRALLATRVAEAITAQINPALERLAAYLEGPYASEAPGAVGVSQYPDGVAYYRHLVRHHTTLDVTPEEVHRIGLAEVARLDTAMAAVRSELGFSGTALEFHAKLRTDPKFFAKTPEEVGSRLAHHDARIRPRIDPYFSRQPRAQGDVRRLDPRLEPVMTFGFYQQPSTSDSMGHYFFNGSHLDQRPLVNAAALIYHELVPGHHFQMALSSENPAIPRFLRDGGYTAFIEGWGEYASALAGEMGMYSDPYDRYGRLLMDMFLSCRLVVDTGMNFLGWSREKATEFMKEHTLESDTQLETETLRYSVDLPGQALAYKMGSLELLRLRSVAKRSLGERFDIRMWHEKLLGQGQLPLSVLRIRMGS
jgi:uncharacterized protein (DUF885 family)